MFVLMLLGLFLGFLIVVPLLLLGLALRLVLGLVFGLVLGLVGLLLVGAVLLVPLLPIVAVVVGIWLILRLARRPAAAQLAAG